MDGLLNQKPKESAPLPVLRDDLDVVPSAPLANGAPAWVIFDPAANRYYEIGRELLDMLILWRVGTADDLIRAVKSEFGRVITEDDVENAMRFLISNALVRDIANNDYAMMAAKAEEEKKSFLSQAMHSYLFFRIPLFRPDRFLQATWPYVAPLFTKTATIIYVLIGLMGLYLVSRQWEHFSGTFQFMLSWQGAVFYGISLVVVKSIHELGHAYMSVRYGLRVPTIGIAFMVLMPVLYTDTSGAWRLRSRRQRLMIDGAGIFTELTLAAVATFLWVFLPDGGFRLCVFAVATTSWITSLVVNLNPLMRFDGYYILSDSLGFQNLQNRGFEMARWRLRELLFGLGEPAPEVLTRRMRRIVIAHAWATWIYRFFLFLGIAILVYAFFIKIVGIILFVIEILWFIVLPVAREIGKWWEMRSKIVTSFRFWLTGAFVAAAAALSIVPWSTRIVIPAVMTAEQEQKIFSPFAARIEEINMAFGQPVKKGDFLVQLSAPQLQKDLKLAEERRSLIENRIDRSGSDVEDRASLIVLSNELSEVKEEIEGLKRVIAQMRIVAPFDGVLADVDTELQEGLWINPKMPLATVLTRGAPAIKGYVAETDVFRFEAGSNAKFIPENIQLPIVDVRVRKISEASSDQLENAYLALPFGGSIAIEDAKQEELRPTEAAYAVSLVAVADEDVLLPQKANRGVAVIEGEPQSFYDRARKQVLKVLIREMGV